MPLQEGLSKNSTKTEDKDLEETKEQRVFPNYFTLKNKTGSHNTIQDDTGMDQMMQDYTGLYNPLVSWIKSYDIKL